MSSRELEHLRQDRLIEAEDQEHVLDTAGIEVSTHLWYVWTEVAIEHEWLARRARRAYGADRTDVTALEDEGLAAYADLAR